MQAGPLHAWVTGLTCSECCLSGCLGSPAGAHQMPCLVLVALASAAHDSSISHLRALCCLSRALTLMQLNLQKHSACLQAKCLSQTTWPVSLQCSVGWYTSFGHAASAEVSRGSVTQSKAMQAVPRRPAELPCRLTSNNHDHAASCQGRKYLTMSSRSCVCCAAL